MRQSAEVPVSKIDNKSLVGVVSQVEKGNVEMKFLDSADGGGTTASIGDYCAVIGKEYCIIGQLIDVSSGEQQGVTLGNINLLATVHFSNNKITQGVVASPQVGQRIYLAPPELVRSTLGMKDQGKELNVKLQLATVDAAGSAPLDFTPESVYGRHMAILGTTGGGKSWTISKLLEETAKFQSKVILLDATGEFGDLDHLTRHVYLGHDPNPRPDAIEVALPYFQLKESDLFAIFRPTGQSQAPKLRAAIKSLKLAMLDPSLGLNGMIMKADKNKAQFLQSYQQFAHIVEAPDANFDISKLARQVENECVNPNRSSIEHMVWGGINGLDHANCMPLVTRISDILQSQNLAPIFAPHGKRSLIEEIDEFLKNPHERILQISLEFLSFAHSAREIIANAIGRHLLRFAREGMFKKNPLLLVVDEAHQFLHRSTSDESHQFALDSFALIAKEGRKYALNICIATQRPRDIPEGVLSQMGTIIVHRLINDRDRSVIERASTELDRSSLGSLPTLAPGEAVIIGVDFPVPLKVKVCLPSCPPNSEGPNFQRYWR